MRQLFQRLGAWAGLDVARCPVCATLTHDRSGALCSTCADALSPRPGGYCPSCGDIYGDEDNTPSICGECRTSPPPWDHLYFHSIYAGKLRDLILGYKFHRGLGHARLLADMAYTSYIERAEHIPDAIIPVPLHQKRLLWRGFNQSAELSRLLSRKLDRPILNKGLVRIRHTQPQTTLGMVERRENIKAAFEADTEAIKGKSVLLVDDVYTTGATLRECARTVKRAGAKSVEVLVLARAMG